MKSPLKNLKKYFQLIMTALICFVMGVIEDKVGGSCLSWLFYASNEQSPCS